MSILIKCMEMPRSCAECWALDDYGDYPRCRITDEQRGYNYPIWEKRMDRCPLVPVPPHGRLGDLDALRKRIEENIDAAKKAGNHEWWYDCTVALDFALAAPTVIDAEDGE